MVQTNAPIILGSKPKKKGGVLATIASLALKPSTLLGNLATSGLEKVTGKKFGRTKSEELAETKAGKALGLGIAATGLALAAVVNPLGTAKTLSVPATVAILAPETTKKVLSVPGAGEIVVAGAVAGAPGAIAVASEKGISLLETALGKAPDIIKEHTPEIVAAAGITAAAAAVAIGGDDLIEKAKSAFAGAPEIPIPEAAVLPFPSAPASEVQAGNYPAYPEPGTSAPRKRRKTRSKAQQQTISQRVNVLIVSNKNIKTRAVCI